MSRNKKIIIIVSAIAVLALGLGIFFAWQKSSQTAPDELLPSSVPGITATPATSTTQIKSVTGTLSVLSKNKAIDYWIYTPISTSTALAKNIIYVSPDGAIFAITNGKDQRINSIQVNSIQSIKASSDGKWVFIKSGDLNQPKFDFLNVEKNIWQPTATDIVAADWSLDGEKLAYLQNNPVTKSFDLMIKDMDINVPVVATSTKSTVIKNKNLQPQKIISLNQTGFDLKWYETDRILLIPKPSISYISEVWEINIVTK